MIKEIILSSLVIGGCTATSQLPLIEKVVYVTTPLYAPERPILPVWSAQDMECLSPDIKQKMRDRDILRRQYTEQLETIIKSTIK